MADQPVIIIRRKKKGGGHGGHHGGAWKVAYADFVTAMMSFFLLLWLLNVTTSEQRKGIADYFAPENISKSESGAGGMFGGESISSKTGGEISDRSPPSAQEATIPTVGEGEEGDEDTKGGALASKEGKAGQAGKPSIGSMSASKAALAAVDKIQQEEEAFKSAEQTLKQALLASPELQSFAGQIFVDRTPEGLRIQIVDREKFSMFPSGGAVPYARGRDLLLLVGKIVARLSNSISITGHTDGQPFVIGSGRDNWTLSTDRANTSREYLIKAGVDEKRIARVSGLADREPFIADPKDPRNRRISIVLMRQPLASPAPTETAKAP